MAESVEPGEKMSTDDRGAKGRIERLTTELDQLNLPPTELNVFFKRLIRISSAAELDQLLLEAKSGRISL